MGIAPKTCRFSCSFWGSRGQSKVVFATLVSPFFCRDIVTQLWLVLACELDAWPKDAEEVGPEGLKSLGAREDETAEGNEKNKMSCMFVISIAKR